MPPAASGVPTPAAVWKAGMPQPAVPQNWQQMLTQLPAAISHRKPLSDNRGRLAVSTYI